MTLGSMDTCPSCGAYVQPDWKRCKLCDFDLRDPEARPVGSGEAEAEAPPPNRTPVLIASALLVALVVGGILYFVLTGDDGGGDAEPALGERPPGTADSLEGDAPARRVTDRTVTQLCTREIPDIDGAVPFDPTSAEPRAVVVALGHAGMGSDQWTVRDDLLGDLRPRLPADTQLVACIAADGRELVATCPGVPTEGGAGRRVDLEVYSASLVLEVREAHSGETVITTPLDQGSLECPAVLEGSPSGIVARSVPVNREQLEALVLPVVAPSEG